MTSNPYRPMTKAELDAKQLREAPLMMATVPPLYGMTLEQAKSMANAHGLEAEEYVPPPLTRWQRLIARLRSSLRRNGEV